MSWNGSSQTGSAAPSPAKKPSGKSPSVARGIAVGVAIALIGLVAVLFVVGDKDSEVAKGEVENKIANACSSPVENVAFVTNIKAESDMAMDPSKQRKVERDRRNGRRLFVPPAYTSHVYTVTVDQKLFSNRAERFIAFLMTVEPGEPILGDADSLMGCNFKQALIESSINKIETSSEDTPYERVLKEQVIAAKKELFERVRNGEDGEKLLREAFIELKNLGVYKQELAAEVKKVVKDGALSDQDVEDTLTAANIMLKNRGISEMKMPSIFKARLRLKEKSLK